MMPARNPHTQTTGNRLFAGHLAGRDLLDAPGPFANLLSRLSHLFGRGPLGDAPTGARATAATRDETSRAPTPTPDTQAPKAAPTFHCPEYPGCGCPGGTMHPDCPGLKDWTANRGMQ